MARPTAAVSPPPRRQRADVVLLLEDPDPGAQVRIPSDVRDLASFRRWVHSKHFPTGGRIDWVDRCVEVDMSPEDLGTHGDPKTAIAGALFNAVRDRRLGKLWIDRARLSNPAADLSAEPDVLLCLRRTLLRGRARLVPRAGGEVGRYVEIEGTADIVVEVVSDSSVTKDTERLRAAYHRAGVAEYWIVDARSEALGFTVLHHAPGGYEPARPGRDGFVRSAVLRRKVRLTRTPDLLGLHEYTLEVRALRRSAAKKTKKGAAAAKKKPRRRRGR